MNSKTAKQENISVVSSFFFKRTPESCPYGPFPHFLTRHEKECEKRKLGFFLKEKAHFEEKMRNIY